MKKKVLVTHSCLTPCSPIYCSPPGSSVRRILQAWILEWVAIPFSRGSSRPRNLGLLHCRQIQYHLSPQRKKRLLWILNLLTGLIWISWKSCLTSCCLLQFRESLTFESPDNVWVQSGLGAFFQCIVGIQESVPWAHWYMGWLAVPDRALSSEPEKDPSGGIFSSRQKSLSCDASCDA